MIFGDLEVISGGHQNPDGSGQAGTNWVEDGSTIAYNHEQRQDIGDGFIEIGSLFLDFYSYFKSDLTQTLARMKIIGREGCTRRLCEETLV